MRRRTKFLPELIAEYIIPFLYTNKFTNPEFEYDDEDDDGQDDEDDEDNNDEDDNDEDE